MLISILVLSYVSTFIEKKSITKKLKRINEFYKGFKQNYRNLVVVA